VRARRWAGRQPSSFASCPGSVWQMISMTGGRVRVSARRPRCARMLWFLSHASPTDGRRSGFDELPQSCSCLSCQSTPLSLDGPPIHKVPPPPRLQTTAFAPRAVVSTPRARARSYDWIWLKSIVWGPDCGDDPAVWGPGICDHVGGTSNCWCNYQTTCGCECYLCPVPDWMFDIDPQGGTYPQPDWDAIPPCPAHAGGPPAATC